MKRGRKRGALKSNTDSLGVGPDGLIDNPFRRILDSADAEKVQRMRADLHQTASALAGIDPESCEAREIGETTWAEFTAAQVKPGSRAHMHIMKAFVRHGARCPAGVEAGILLRKLANGIGELADDPDPSRRMWKAEQAVEAFLRGDFSAMTGCEDLKQIRREQFAGMMGAMLRAISKTEDDQEFFKAVASPPVESLIGSLAAYALNASATAKPVRLDDAREWLRRDGLTADDRTIRRLLRETLFQRIEPGAPGRPRGSSQAAGQ
jgi:hypothetical protein